MDALTEGDHTHPAPKGAIVDLPLAPHGRDETRKTWTGEWEDRGIRIWGDESEAKGG